VGGRLFIGNLSQQTREADLRAGFATKDLELTQVTMVNDPDTGRPRGFAFVELATEAALALAVTRMDRHEIHGRAISVRLAERRALRYPPAAGHLARPRTEVLIVEDDQDVRESVRSALFAGGYSIISAANGRQALEFLRTGACNPAVVLLDLMMPIMDGRGFMAELRQMPIFASVKVILTSALGDIDKDAAALGASAILRKPFGIDDLTAMVAKYSGERALEGQ
jgi:CheY-like chemotaxis protein